VAALVQALQEDVPRNQDATNVRTVERAKSLKIDFDLRIPNPPGPRISEPRFRAAIIV